MVSMSTLERKTIFLYPKGDELEKDSYKVTSHLIKRIKKITFISNRTIKEILYGGCFSHIKCKPLVEMKCISQHNESVLDCSNVRICIAKYNGIDYKSNYNSVIKSAKENRNNISHLVALYISNSKQKPIFRVDEQGDFDAIVETDLDHLDSVLLAIMLDISLYHYFQLSDDIEDRKDFNTVKFNYILSSYNIEEFEKIYGKNTNHDSPFYLPFSLEDVTELRGITNRIHRNKIIKVLITKYSQFLIDCFSTKVVLDKHYYISNSKDIAQDKYYKHLEKYIENLRNANGTNTPCIVYFIAFNYSTENPITFYIEYNKESLAISNWLSALSADFCEFRLFKIVVEV